MFSRKQPHYMVMELVLNQLIAHLPGYFYWKDAQGIYRGCNNAHAKRLGLDYGVEAIGKKDSDFHLDRSSRFLLYDELAMAQGKPCSIEEKVKVLGKTFVFLNIKSPLLSRTDELLGIVNISIDMSREKIEKNKPLYPIRILVAEDNPATAALQLFFTRLGCLVDVVDDPESLLRQVKKETYSFILMDTELVDANGVLLAQKIRKQSSVNRETPIVGFNACI